MIDLLHTQNADLDLTSEVTVLTDTPDAANATLCRACVYMGDGVKDLDASGGLFTVRIVMDSQYGETLSATLPASARAWIDCGMFCVPAGVETSIRIQSPNVADTDVDVTAYLYDISVNTAQVNTQADQALADYDPPTHTEMTNELSGVSAIVLGNTQKARIDTDL
jgi:hypothetical protein